MEKCCIFNQSEESFKENKEFELVKKYGNFNDGPNDSYRDLLKCKKCGALFLHRFLECDANGNDNYYDDYIQVESEEEADQLCAKLSTVFFGDSSKPMIKYGEKAVYSIPEEYK